MPRTFPSHSNGQLIDASHVNDLGDALEVVTAQVFNVRESTYGAVGDGVTDDTAAFQAAITAAIAARGTLFIPPPNPGQFYKIGSTLIIQPASGSAAFLNIDAHTPPSGIQWTGGSDASMFSIRGLQYGRVRGLKILLGAQNDVRVFDIVQASGGLSCGRIVWENCAISLGTGKACNGWRWGAAAGGGEASFHVFQNCIVTQAGSDNTAGHVGWRNLDGNHLASQWTNCATSFLTYGYAASTMFDRLNGAIDAVQTTIPINSTIGFAPVGSFQIDSEKVTYTGISGNSFTGCVRGALSTTAATHVDNTFVNQGIQDPVALTWRYGIIGGAGHTFTGCGGSFNYREFLTLRGALTITGGRWEGVTRLLQVGWQGSTSVEVIVTGITVNVGTLPADGVIVAIGYVGVYTFEQCQFYGVDFTSAMFTAGAYDDMAGPTGTLGSLRIINTMVRATASPVWTIPAAWKFDGRGSYRTNSASQPQAYLVGDGLVSADNGDAAKTLIPKVDSELQRWNTPLTAARAVTLNTAGATHGDHFRIVRESGATGAFNLNIGTGPLKALTAAGQFADVTFDGTAWRLTGNGSL